MKVALSNLYLTGARDGSQDAILFKVAWDASDRNSEWQDYAKLGCDDSWNSFQGWIHNFWVGSECSWVTGTNLTRGSKKYHSAYMLPIFSRYLSISCFLLERKSLSFIRLSKVFPDTEVYDIDLDSRGGTVSFCPSSPTPKTLHDTPVSQYIFLNE